jgi:ABC-type sugar transport system permease subunit
MLKKKKSQIKIQQTAFMLVFLTVFFGMIALIFMGIFLYSLRDSVEIQEQQKDVLKALFLSSASEFACVGDNYCVDLDKIVFLNTENYKNLWKDSSYIRVERLYPENQAIVKNFQDVNYRDEFGSFVALCYSEWDTDLGSGGSHYRKCELSKFLVGVKER